MLERIAHYNILERIGAGGLGEVYRARDTRLGRTVAVKVLPDEIARDPARRERVLREARAAAVISHPSVATLFEVGEEDGRIYLVFEFVPGRPLSADLGGKSMAARSAIDLAIQLADALADAHSAGVVHRDLKPDNILVTPKGRAKILDFGLAGWTRGGAARAAAVTQLTSDPGVVTGTLAYMSPEQASGGPVDERSDIFSLGIVIFEMLTGRNPFARPGAGLMAATAIVRDAAPKPSDVNPRLPAELDPILEKALAKRPEERYQTAATLAAELRAVAAILDVRHGDSEPVWLVTHRTRRGLPWGWIAAALAVAAAAGAWRLWGAQMGALWIAYTGPPPAPVIAVIPEPASDESNDMSAGLAEDLVARLGQTPGLHVLGRSAVRAFRGRSPKAVATELGAKVVLTVSASQSGDELRADLALVDPADGVRVWRSRYERPVKDVLALQAEITDQIARALNVEVEPSAARARTASRVVDLRAYDLYLRGRDASARRDSAREVALYREAVRIDPALAEAQAGLAEALYRQAWGPGRLEPKGLVEEARRAATDAAAVDPDLARAHLALGLVAPTLGDALVQLKQALQIDPTYAEAYRRIGDEIRRFDPMRAIAFYRRALELDPRLDASRASLALAYTELDQFDDAEQEIQKGRSVSPENAAWPIALAVLRLAESRPAEALQAAAQAGDPAGAGISGADAIVSAYALQALGQADQALALARTKVQQDPQFCDTRAMAAALLADRGARPDARDLVAPVFAGAGEPAASPSSIACSAMAAAALGDAGRAAGALRTIAASEPALRLWALDDRPFRRRWYPWSKVAKSSLVRAAAEDVTNGYDRLRAIITDALAGLP